MDDAERCVCCDEIIPEGRQVCPTCEEKISQKRPFGGDPQLRSKYKQALYDVIAKIYAKHPVGGALHIVLDDLNTKDHHITWCIEEVAPEYPEEDQRLFKRCAELLLMVKSQRARRKYIEFIFERLPW